MKKYLFKDKASFVFGILISFLGFFCLLGLFYTYSIITDVVVAKDKGRSIAVIVLVLGIIMVLMLCTILSVFLTRNILQKAVFSLRQDVFCSAYRKSVGQFRKQGANYYSSVLFNDVDLLEDKYFRPMLEIINDSTQIIIMAVALGLIGGKYLLVVALLSLPIIAVPFLLKKQIADRGQKVSQGSEKYLSLIKDTIGMFHTVKYFGKEKQILERFYAGSEKIESTKYKLASIKAFNTCLNSFSVLALKFVSLLYFTDSALNFVIDVATVSLLFSVTNNIGNPIHNILGYIENIHSTKIVREKIEKLIEDKEREKKSAKSLSNSNLLVKDVSLDLGGKRILNRFSFEFLQGSKYAIIGESGSGKSTFCKILLGYFDNYQGEIKLDGVDIKNIDKQQLYQRVVYVSQDTYVYTDTLRNNITLLSDAFSEQQILKAVKDAELEELLKRLENGLDTRIDSENLTLSGGEKQRIALARAFLYNADIYILDEATASLDARNTACIENRILALENKTVISIMHKFSENITQYDSILVVDAGEMVVADSYHALKNRYPELRLLLGEGVCMKDE